MAGGGRSFEPTRRLKTSCTSPLVKFRPTRPHEPMRFIKEASSLICEGLLSEPRQCLGILRPGALQFLGIDPEGVEDSGSDLSSLDTIVDGCRNDRRVRSKKGYVAVVLGEAAVLGEFAATRV